MKKVLLASTALMLTAGFASAQSIDISGSANAGVKYFSEADPEVGELTPHYEVNFVFSGSGMNDYGLEYGAFINLDEGGVDDAEVFISGSWGTLTMGDVSAATDGFGLRDLGFDGLGIDDFAEVYKNATADADVVYTYSASGFTIIASAEFGDENSIGIAGEYSMNGFSAGAGYITDNNGATEVEIFDDYFDDPIPIPFVDSNRTWVVELGYDQGPFAATAFYSSWDQDGGPGGEGWGFDFAYDAGSAVVSAVYANTSLDGARVGNGYGIGVSVPVGGGMSVAGGVGLVDFTDEDIGLGTVFPWDSAIVADLGVIVSF